jgi:lysophospholipase L1-like esterase
MPYWHRGSSVFLYKIIALLTLPLLILQGKKVRASALQLAEADGPRQGIDRQSPSQTRKKLSILVIGDSAAAGVGASTQDHALLGNIRKNISSDIELHWCLIAKSGMQTKDIRSFVEQSLHTTSMQFFDVVVTSLGVNDVTSLSTSKQRLEALDNLFRYCAKHLNTQHIIISGMPPMLEFPLLPQPLRYVLGTRAIDFDNKQQSYIRAQYSKTISAIVSNHNLPNLHYLPLNFAVEGSAMAEDGFHPGPKIYEHWGRCIADIILIKIVTFLSPKA